MSLCCEDISFHDHCRTGKSDGTDLRPQSYVMPVHRRVAGDGERVPEPVRRRRSPASNVDMISYIDGEWRMTQGYIAGGEESFTRF